jgi:hypothetical protein
VVLPGQIGLRRRVCARSSCNTVPDQLQVALRRFDLLFIEA